MSDRFIVKMQISLQVTIHNESRSVCQQFRFSPKLRKQAGPKLERYFWAHIDKKKMLCLDEYAPEQGW